MIYIFRNSSKSDYVINAGNPSNKLVQSVKVHENRWHVCILSKSQSRTWFLLLLQLSRKYSNL